MVWDGKDKRSDVGCASLCADIQSRVSKLEAYHENQVRDIDRLIRDNGLTRDSLAKTNQNLAVAVSTLKDIKVTQRNTHVFAGSLGAFLGGLGTFLGHKLLGG